MKSDQWLDICISVSVGKVKTENWVKKFCPNLYP